MSEEFKDLVEAFGRELRGKSYDELLSLQDVPTRTVEIDARRGTIDLIVEDERDVALRVVIQGFLDGKWLTSVKNVALDGFRIGRDGQITALRDEEFYEFD